MKIKLEYIWLDGSKPQQLRSKTKIINSFQKKNIYERPSNISEFNPNMYDMWSFDGSSTLQANAGKGENTDCLLKPVFVVNDPFRGTPHKLVLCEVLNPDGTTHESNNRRYLEEKVNELNLNESDKSNSAWFGWEQEYTLTHKPKYKFAEGEGLPLGFETPPGGKDTPRPQGDYYCGIGSDTVIGREIVEKHMDMCLEVGLDISGINAEVLLGQWEYQIGPVTSLNGSDQLWMSRYILQRVAELWDVNVSFHPKPLQGDWNGTGCHVNFSTKEMREEGGIELIKEAMPKLESNHEKHIEVYGLFNDMRLTGAHETSSIHDFSYGFSTRDTSIRIPAQSLVDGRGYFEDRRPASNCDPYQVSLRMLKTIFN
jgi:glutamine synthetase